MTRAGRKQTQSNGAESMLAGEYRPMRYEDYEEFFHPNMVPIDIMISYCHESIDQLSNEMFRNSRKLDDYEPSATVWAFIGFLSVVWVYLAVTIILEY